MKKLLLALALVASSAHAEFASSGRIIELMKGDKLEQISAGGYVAGVYDTGVGVYFCPAKEPSFQALMEFAYNALETTRTPEKAGSEVLIVAFNAKWPCKKREVI